MNTVKVNMPGPFAPNPVLERGDGQPVVYLHGLFGQEWPEFLDAAAHERRVIAPSSPGIEDSSDLKHVDNVYELVHYYRDLFTSLGLDRFDLVGHSYGGMVAAEYAATFGGVDRLVLIDSLGLWLDECPVEDFLVVNPETLRKRLWSDVANAPSATEQEERGDDLSVIQSRMSRQFATLASTSKFCYPFAEHGLRKRLRKIKCPSLVIWGAEDGLVAPRYAEEFKALLTDVTVAIVDGAGHNPHFEAPHDVAKLIGDFLEYAV